MDEYGQYTDTCTDEAKAILQKFRDGNDRRSEEIIEIFEDCLSSSMQKLSDERWLIYEQVFIAALDCARQDIAQKCLAALKHQFPDSMRVKRLMAMQHESLGYYEKAERIYDAIIKADFSQSFARKRKIAVLRAQNKITEAIGYLVAYTKQFMSDYEAWIELSDLYIIENDYNKAAFCVEELILSNPHNHLYHQRYAEIRYTQGGPENLELARAHFAQALLLNSDNVRALYGLFLASNFVAAPPKGSKKKENVKYAIWAAKQIQEKYRKAQTVTEGQLNAIQEMLNALQVSN